MPVKSKHIILALDLGTTGNRALAFNEKGELLVSEYKEFTQYFPQPGWVEHDATEIWDSTLAVLKAVLRQIDTHKIKGLGITNQRETTVLWDITTGNPVHKAIVWQCRRTSDRCKTLSEHAPTIKEKTGLFLDPYFSATKIEWLIQHVPDIQDKIDKKKIRFGTIDSWIIWKLTGGKTHITDASNASRTLLVNIHTGDYDSSLLKLFNIPKTLLPKIVESSGHVADTDPNTTGISLPITGIIGDQQAALFTQCGLKTNTVKNTYGTGLFIVTPTGKFPLKSDTLISTIAWKLNGELYYALEGSVFIGGAAIQWLRDELKIIATAAETDGMATQSDNNNGVYFIPALSGLGAPFWAPEARGLLLGLTRGTSQGDIVRATLESLAYQTRAVMDEMSKIKSSPYSSLLADGGAVKNAFLMQFQSDVLDLPVHVPKITETTAFGAAGMAGIAVGLWTVESFSKLNTIEKKYTPNNPPSANATYKIWRRAVDTMIQNC